jgi:Rod binding domain-containing protein
MVTGIVTVTVSTFGIGTAEMVMRQLLSGRTVITTETETETATVVRLLSTASDR